MSSVRPSGWFQADSQ